jgi:hypothetical protein
MLGELEITFLMAFCRASNLCGMLASPEVFPGDLKPYILQLKNIYDPVPFTPWFVADPLRVGKLSSLDFQKLVDLLNAESEDTAWAVASNWTLLSEADKKKIAPISSRCEFHPHFNHKGVLFSTWEANSNNSVISVNPNLPKMVHFAQIESIFTQTRTTTTREQITDTWLKVKPFPPVQRKNCNVFDDLRQPALQLHLRLPVSNNE